MNLPEWAASLKAHAVTSSARCRELYIASAEVAAPQDYGDLIAKIRLRLREIEYENDRLAHDVRNLEQAITSDAAT